MKILILGSEGMLGTALMRVFPDAIGYDKNELDITDHDALHDALYEREPDFVINAAAYTNVDNAESEPALAALVNGKAPLYIAEICRDISATLVHFSTDYVFDGKNPDGYNEEDEPNPINTYGRSKLLGEKAIQENLGHYFIVRTSWLFGPNGKNFVDTMLKLGRDKKELKVTDDQIGKPTYTFDLADAVQKLITHDFSYGIYHITNEDAVSWHNFACEIFNEVGLKVNVKAISSDELDRPAERPLCSILKNNKFPLLRSHKSALAEYLKRCV